MDIDRFREYKGHLGELVLSSGAVERFLKATILAMAGENKRLANAILLPELPNEQTLVVLSRVVKLLVHPDCQGAWEELRKGLLKLSEERNRFFHDIIGIDEGELILFRTKHKGNDNQSIERRYPLEELKKLNSEYDYRKEQLRAFLEAMISGEEVKPLRGDPLRMKP